jgi:hypothetical protein
LAWPWVVIPETVSSWTVSRQVAEKFRENDRDREKVLMIFARRPADDVILNLNAPYADLDFMETVKATAAQLSGEFRGIDRWLGTQEEAVLEETTITNDEIISLGAFRQLSDVVRSENLNPGVVVMESAKDGRRFDALGPLNRARDWCILSKTDAF